MPSTQQGKETIPSLPNSSSTSRGSIRRAVRVGHAPSHVTRSLLAGPLDGDSERRRRAPVAIDLAQRVVEPSDHLDVRALRLGLPREPVVGPGRGAARGRAVRGVSAGEGIVRADVERVPVVGEVDAEGVRAGRLGDEVAREDDGEVVGVEAHAAVRLGQAGVVVEDGPGVGGLGVEEAPGRVVVVTRWDGQGLCAPLVDRLLV